MDFFGLVGISLTYHCIIFDPNWCPVSQKNDALQRPCIKLACYSAALQSRLRNLWDCSMHYFKSSCLHKRIITAIPTQTPIKSRFLHQTSNAGRSSWPKKCLFNCLWSSHFCQPYSVRLHKANLYFKYSNES